MAETDLGFGSPFFFLFFSASSMASFSGVSVKMRVLPFFLPPLPWVRGPALGRGRTSWGETTAWLVQEKVSADVEAPSNVEGPGLSLHIAKMHDAVDDGWISNQSKADVDGPGLSLHIAKMHDAADDGWISNESKVIDTSIWRKSLFSSEAISLMIKTEFSENAGSGRSVTD